MSVLEICLLIVVRLRSSVSPSSLENSSVVKPESSSSSPIPFFVFLRFSVFLFRIVDSLDGPMVPIALKPKVGYREKVFSSISMKNSSFIAVALAPFLEFSFVKFLSFSPSIGANTSFT